MSNNLVGGVGSVVKVHVDMANTGLKEELAVVPDHQLTHNKFWLAHRSLFSLTTNPTSSSLKTCMTHRKERFGYRLFALLLAMVLAAARAARFALDGSAFATSCLTYKSSIGDANGTNGPRTFRSPFLSRQLLPIVFS
jgi:hypothetical protein